MQANVSTRSIGSAAEEVESDEFTHAHLLPKVMVPYITKPGDTPREVQIQRWEGCGD